MIKFLSDWVQKIAIAVIIVSIFEFILPDGKLKKYIKVVLGIYVVFCIISPFVNSSIWNNLDNIDLENYIENSTAPVSANVENTNVEDIYLKELQNNIEKKVQEKGYSVNKCTIDADLSNESDNPGIHKISLILETKQNASSIQEVNISIQGMNEQKQETEGNNYITQSKEIDELKQMLSDFYEISKDIIDIRIKK